MSSIVAGGVVSGGALGTPSSGNLQNTNAITKLGQSTLPLVLLPSGSFGNNGAWTTANAAQQTTYPNAYVYVPAGAIAAGSLAGWYYAVFSSTTAATVYNNTYTSGTPIIPGSPTAFSTTGPGAYTQTTGSNIASYTLSIPGNTIGLNGGIRIFASRSNNNTAGNKILTVNYDTYSIYGLTNTTPVFGSIVAGFSNRGIANVQTPLSISSAASQNGLGNLTSYPTPGTIDSTTTKNLTFNMQLATATDTMTLESVVVELLPSV